MFSRLQVARDLDVELVALEQDQEALVGVGDLDDRVHQRVEQLRARSLIHQALAELVELAQAARSRSRPSSSLLSSSATASS